MTDGTDVNGLDFAAVSKSRRVSSVISRRVAAELVMALDFVLIALSACLTGLLTHYIQRGFFDFGEAQLFLGAGMLGGALTVGFLATAQMYRFEQFFSMQAQVGPIFSRWSLVMLILVAVAFMTKTSGDYSRGWIIAWYAVALGLLFVSRPILREIFRGMSKQGGILGRHVALVGATDLSRRFREIAEDREAGLTIVGLFDDRHGRREDAAPQPVSGTLDDLIALAQTGRVDEIIVTLPWSAEQRVSDLVRRLSVLPVSIRLCPDQVGLHFRHREYDTVAGVKVLEANPRPLDGWGAVFKDAEDKVLSTLLLAFLMPFFALIAIAIKIDSRGPILFKQRRHGFNHKVFHIYKFRTMKAQDDGDVVVQASKHDDRVTRVGWLLRRTSIDELPQLFNVLKGEMSLVGPRPHALAHNDEYAKLIRDYAMRHRVKPGITGWAQVNGFRGETSTPEKMAARVAHDLYYIENWSPIMDVKILILTAWTLLFSRKNAY